MFLVLDFSLVVPYTLLKHMVRSIGGLWFGRWSGGVVDSWRRGVRTCLFEICMGSQSYGLGFLIFLRSFPDRAQSFGLTFWSLDLREYSYLGVRRIFVSSHYVVHAIVSSC